MFKCHGCNKELAPAKMWTVRGTAEDHGWGWFFCGSGCLGKWLRSKVEPAQRRFPMKEG